MTLRILLALLLLLAPAFGQTAGTISTVAGTGVAGFNGDDMPAIQASLNFGIGDVSVDEEDIIHITVDAAGNLYLPDRDNHRIRKVDTGGKITTVAGNGTYDFKGDGGPATSASLAWASSVKLDAAGNLVIADQQNNAVRRVGSDGVIRTIAGAPPNFGFAGNGGPATRALMDYPTDVAFDTAGNMYIADQFNSWIRRVSTDGVMSVFAGDVAQPNVYAFSGDGGPANKATLDFPAGVAVDRSSGNVYFADQFNHRIRRVLPDGTIATVAGSGRAGGTGGGYAGDGGQATSALLNFPVDVAVDGFGNLFIADQKNDRIRMVSTSGIITTVAGSGQKGFSGDGGPATQASLDGPSGVALDASGNLYIVDHYNNRIRKVTFAPTAAFPANGVTSAASFLPGHVAPGQIISIFGVNLGPATGVSAALDPATGKLATTLGDTTVLFNNIPGPLFFVRQDQINVQVPYEVSLAGNAQIVVRSKVGTSSAVLIPTGPSAPGIFTVGGGRGQAALLNQDSTVNSATNPADRGTVVQIFMTGQGAVSPAVATGALAPTQPPFALASLPVAVTIGGKTATVQFSGLAPGFVGLLQVNATVPQDVTPGAAVDLSVKVGDIASQGAVTLAVR